MDTLKVVWSSRSRAEIKAVEEALIQVFRDHIENRSPKSGGSYTEGLNHVYVALGYDDQDD